MKTKNPIFSLRNFRSFGEDGADFELAPITVLTGCNSAGKSSLVKALLLLSSQSKGETMGSTAYDIRRNMPASQLNISTKTLMLGQFDKVLHDKSESREFSFSYKIWSDCLQENVIVRRRFVPNKTDFLKNAILRDLIIEKNDGTLIYKVDSMNYEWEENFSAIEEYYNRFIRVIEFLEAKRDYTLFVEGNFHDISQQVDEKTIEIVKHQYQDACDNLNELNIQVECYGKKTINEWTKQYCDPLNKSKIDTIIEESRSEEEKEEKKRNSFMSFLVNEVITTWFTKGIEYINSSSAIINRLYSSEDENKMSKALRTWNERSSSYHQLGDFPDIIQYKPGRFLNKWVKIFNLGDSIEIEGTSEGLGMLIYLVKEGKRRLLADEGYGITQLVSLLLQIDNKIELERPDYKEYVCPTKVICVEEPEVHLHPKYQSLLAEMFVEAYQRYNIRFIIETHSEYLIRKLQVMVADKEKALSPDDVSLNYVEKDENGVSSNRKIEILEDGRLSEPFGPGFFDEADTLAMEILKYKARRK